MKKTTKPAKTPAPATKIPVPIPAAKPVAPVVKSTVAPKIKKAPDAAPAPAVVTKPKVSNVTIIADVDVGYGNALYVRGDAPALSWDKGLALGCVADAKWEIVLSHIEKPFELKFLINDSSWSAGENFTASPGDTLTLTPSF
jgi:hypothetical protein